MEAEKQEHERAEVKLEENIKNIKQEKSQDEVEINRLKEQGSKLQQEKEEL